MTMCKGLCYLGLHGIHSCAFVCFLNRQLCYDLIYHSSTPFQTAKFLFIYSYKETSCHPNEKSFLLYINVIFLTENFKGNFMCQMLNLLCLNEQLNFPYSTLRNRFYCQGKGGLLVLCNC